jgi:Cys-rich repeat protein
MRWNLASILICSLVPLLAACPGDDTPSTSGTEGTSSGSGTSTGVTPTTVDDTGVSMTSTTNASTDDAESSTGPVIEGSSSSSDDGGASSSSSSEGTSTGSSEGSSSSESSSSTDGGGTDPTESGSTTEGGGLFPDGAACEDGSQCASGSCYSAGLLGGICGECESDADCAGGGCTLPNPLDGTPSVCNDGSLGDGCESDAVCMPELDCATVFDVPGVITLSTCSECQTDLDCGGQLCAPTYDVGAFEGSWSCVDAGSVPDDGGCDLNGSGDEQCASGACGTADVMGLLQVGVCGECLVDGDCAPGETCEPASIDLAGGATGASCV